MYANDLCFSTSVPSLVQSILQWYGSCSHGAEPSILSCLGSSSCLDTSRWHSCMSVVHPFACLLPIDVCKGWSTFPLIFRYSLALVSFALCSTGNHCNQWQHLICRTGLTLKEYRVAVCNGCLAWVCGLCLAQENEQPANNHDEVLY